MNLMQSTNRSKNLLASAAAATMLVATVTLALSPLAGAASVVSTSPVSGATVTLAEGETFKLTVTAEQDPSNEQIHALEVDSKAPGKGMPTVKYQGSDVSLGDFSLYTSASGEPDAPYGTNPLGGDKDIFESVGASATVTEDDDAIVWTMDFGQEITEYILNENDGNIQFAFALLGIDGDDENRHTLWAGMYGDDIQRFDYRLVRANSDKAPGVPNTSGSTSSSGVVLTAIGTSAAVLAAAVVYRRYSRQ